MCSGSRTECHSFVFPRVAKIVGYWTFRLSEILGACYGVVDRRDVIGTNAGTVKMSAINLANEKSAEALAVPLLQPLG
jgi:hypothetical protein